MQDLVAAFPVSDTKSPPPEPPQQLQCIKQTPDYHTCKLCSAAFSSMARLIRHTQESNCNKPTCNRCDQIFTSRNQLHEHLRTKCSAANPTVTLHSPHQKPSTPPPTYRAYSPQPPAYKCSVPKNYLTIHDLFAKYAPLRAQRKSASQHQSASPPPQKQPSAPATPPATPPPTYRVVSPPPPAYKAKKAYLTIEDLYMRYAPLRAIRSARQSAYQSACSNTIAMSCQDATRASQW